MAPPQSLLLYLIEKSISLLAENNLCEELKQEKR